MSAIVVGDVERYIQYIATASQTIFDYPFVITDELNLTVYSTPDGSAADDVNQVLILNVDYTVTGVGVDSGGTIVLTSGATLDDRVTIIGDQTIERTTNLQNNNLLDADTLNAEFNNLTIMLQELRKDVNKILPKYFNSELQDPKNLHLPALGTDEYWKKTTLGIEGVEIEESEGWSTLRSELANDQTGTDGSLLVGYYDSGFGSTTVHDAMGQLKEGRYGVDTGVADAYVVTLSPAPSSLDAGLIVDVKIANTNTTASTINVNGLGAVAIKIFLGSVIADIPANAMPAGLVARLIYDGSFFQLANAQEITDFTTGYVALTYNTTAPSGWVDLDDGTIGDSGSGATTRANADTFDLFEMLWDNVSSPTANAFCAVSGGLGASALADFSAGKQLTLPYYKGRAIAGFGTAAGFSYAPVLGAYDGEPDHLLIEAEMPLHDHECPIEQSNPPWGRGTATYSNLGGLPGGVSTTTADLTNTTGGTNAHNNIQPTTHVNTIIKL